MDCSPTPLASGRPTALGDQGLRPSPTFTRSATTTRHRRTVALRAPTVEDVRRPSARRVRRPAQDPWRGHRVTSLWETRDSSCSPTCSPTSSSRDAVSWRSPARAPTPPSPARRSSTSRPGRRSRWPAVSTCTAAARSPSRDASSTASGRPPTASAASARSSPRAASTSRAGGASLRPTARRVHPRPPSSVQLRDHARDRRRLITQAPAKTDDGEGVAQSTTRAAIHQPRTLQTATPPALTHGSELIGETTRDHVRRRGRRAARHHEPRAQPARARRARRCRARPRRPRPAAERAHRIRPQPSRIPGRTGHKMTISCLLLLRASKHRGYDCQTSSVWIGDT
jgi:hypothetical protein